MPGRGSENRQRQIVLKARFTEEEAALIKAQADRAGVSVASLFRYAVLSQNPPPSSRTPPIDRVQAAQLIPSLCQGVNHGPMTETLRQCQVALLASSRVEVGQDLDHPPMLSDQHTLELGIVHWGKGRIDPVGKA